MDYLKHLETARHLAAVMQPHVELVRAGLAALQAHRDQATLSAFELERAARRRLELLEHPSCRT